MNHFEKDGVAHYTGGGFKVVRRKIAFGGIGGNIGKLIYSISPKVYEAKWCYIFRPSSLTYIVQVNKPSGI